MSVGFHFSLRLWERGREIAPLDLSPRFEPKPFPGTSLDSLLQRYGVEAWEPPPAAAPQDSLTPPEAPTQEPDQVTTQEPATLEQPSIAPGARRPVVVPKRDGLDQLFPTEPEGNGPDMPPRLRPGTGTVPDGAADDAGRFPATAPPAQPPETTTPMRPTLLPELMPLEPAPAPPLPLPAAPSLSPSGVPAGDPE